jgi:hypothetical protein
MPPSKFSGLIGVGWSGNNKRTYSDEAYMKDVPDSGAKIFRVVINPGFDTKQDPHNVEHQQNLNDKLFKFMAENNSVKILPNVSGIPGMDTGNKLPPIGVKSKDHRPRTRWINGLKMLVNRYGPEGAFWKAHPGLNEALAPVYWEIWNEENEERNADFQLPGETGQGGKTGEIDPDRYGTLLEISHNVIEEVNKANKSEAPQMKVMFGGLLTGTRNRKKPATSKNRGPSHFSVGKFIKETHHAGDYDALSLHPYAFKGSAKDIAGKVAKNVRAARAALNDRGGEGKKIWVTEIGWPVDENKVEHDGVHTPVSASTQKARLEPTFDELKSVSGSGPGEFNIGNIFWYNIRDFLNGNGNRAEWAAHCGLFTDSGAKRGVLEAFENEAK